MIIICQAHEWSDSVINGTMLHPSTAAHLSPLSIGRFIVIGCYCFILVSAILTE